MSVVNFPDQNPNVIDGEPSDARWRVFLEYRDGNSGSTQELFIEEISELDGIIEQGPDWNTLVRCVVTLNRPSATETEE